jgi:SNF2 family DNA or RNA helicase
MSNTVEVNNQIATIARGILQPLCEETAKVLEPIKLEADDRLHISLNNTAKSFLVKAYREHHSPDGQLEMLMSSGAARHWSQRVPECVKIDDFGSEWQMAATDITALIINALWPESQLVFEGEARTVYDFLLLRFMQQTISSQQRAIYDLNGSEPELPDDWFDHSEKPLAPYQRVGSLTTIGLDGSGLFMEQGTGKTPTQISRIMYEAAQMRRRDPNSMMRVLIVAPKNVRRNWRNEVYAFATLPGKVTILKGTQLDRVKLLVEAMQPDPECLYSIVICSYEAVDRSWDAIEVVGENGGWDLGVLDESHFVKNPYCKRQQTFFKLRDLCRMRSCMTGTPVTNTLLDLYGQFEFMGEGLSGFQSWKKFRSFYAKYERDAITGRDEFMGYKNLPFLQERLARLSFMISKKKALPDLPPKNYDTLEVSMTRLQAKYYKDLCKQLALEIGEDLDSPDVKKININCILTKLLRLAQITSGFVSWDANVDDEGEVLAPKRIEFLPENPKLEALMEIIKTSSPKSKLQVWTCFRPDIQQISARLTKEGVKHVVFYGSTSDKVREQAEHDFNNDPDTKVFVGNPAAGGVGLNLRGYNPDAPVDHGMNCDHVIYLAQNWSMVGRAQSEDRAHRRGTRVPVQYTTVFVPDSIDEEIFNRVNEKIQAAMSIQDVKNIMKRVLETLPMADD